MLRWSVLKPNPTTSHHPRTLGKSWAVVVFAIVVLAGVGASTYFVIRYNRNTPVVQPTLGDPDLEIIDLQEEFKRFIENQLDMIDLLPSVKVYTKRYPDRDAGHILLAQVLMKMELYSEAYPALDRALEGHANNFELQKLTGTCAAKLGLWEDAERHLLIADELKKDETVVLLLANLYFQTARLDLAQDTYEEAKKMSGMTPPHKANAGLAEVFAARGDYDEALNKITLAIKWAQGDSEVQIWVYHLSKVRILFDAEQWDKGETLLRSTQANNPEAVFLLPCARLRARLQAHQGEPDLAAGELAILANPAFAPVGQTDHQRADIFAEYAYWLLEAGDTAKAREVLGVLREIAPDHDRLAALQTGAGAAE